MSQDLHKISIDFSNIELKKLQSHELFGLYLLGEISFSKLKELFQISNADELHFLIKRVCLDIDAVSQKDESMVEIDL